MSDFTCLCFTVFAFLTTSGVCEGASCAKGNGLASSWLRIFSCRFRMLAVIVALIAARLDLSKSFEHECSFVGVTKSMICGFRLGFRVRANRMSH